MVSAILLLVASGAGNRLNTSIHENYKTSPNNTGAGQRLKEIIDKNYEANANHKGSDRLLPGDEIAMEGNDAVTPAFSSRGSKRRLQAITDKKFLWPENVVKYDLSLLADYEKKKVNYGVHILGIRLKGCLTFQETAQGNRIQVSSLNEGCYSKGIGYQGTETQQLNLQGYRADCQEPSTVQHEFMHAIGFGHTHTRNDRERYINVNRTNSIYTEGSAKEGLWGNYEIALDTMTFDLPYDYASVMHYKIRGAVINKDARKRGDKILNVKDTTKERLIGNPDPLSIQDVRLVELLYKCKVESYQPIHRPYHDWKDRGRNTWDNKKTGERIKNGPPAAVGCQKSDDKKEECGGKDGCEWNEPYQFCDEHIPTRDELHTHAERCAFDTTTNYACQYNWYMKKEGCTGFCSRCTKDDTEYEGQKLGNDIDLDFEEGIFECDEKCEEKTGCNYAVVLPSSGDGSRKCRLLASVTLVSDNKGYKSRAKGCQKEEGCFKYGHKVVGGILEEGGKKVNDPVECAKLCQDNDDCYYFFMEYGETDPLCFFFDSESKIEKAASEQKIVSGTKQCAEKVTHPAPMGEVATKKEEVEESIEATEEVTTKKEEDEETSEANDEVTTKKEEGEETSEVNDEVTTKKEEGEETTEVTEGWVDKKCKKADNGKGSYYGTTKNNKTDCKTYCDEKKNIKAAEFNEKEGKCKCFTTFQNATVEKDGFSCIIILSSVTR